MFRVVLYLLVSVLLISVLRAVIGAIMKGFADLFHPAPASSAGPPRPSVTPGGELKKDPVCGTFISAATTFQKKAGGATHYFCSDATATGSASWGSSVYGCISYVDIYGNEGPCSPTSTVFTSVASKQIDVGFAGGTGPLASAGAVGYTVYLSLSGGTYAAAYKMPLTSANCALTTLETVIPACKVTNATYGQTGVNAVFGGTQYPVVTSQLWMGVGGTSSTTDTVGNSNARTTYAYAPSNHAALLGVVSSSQAFGGATAPALNLISGNTGKVVLDWTSLG